MWLCDNASRDEEDNQSDDNEDDDEEGRWSNGLELITTMTTAFKQHSVSEDVCPIVLPAGCCMEL